MIYAPVDPPAPPQEPGFYDQWFKDDYERWLASLPTNEDGHSEYIRVLRALESKCPLARPVVIERHPKNEDGSYGDFRHGCSDHFLIVMRNTLTELESTEVLIHEWAHGLTWRPASIWAPWQAMPQPIHGHEWGLAYARAYRAAICQESANNIDSFMDHEAHCLQCGKAGRDNFVVRTGEKAGEHHLKCRKCGCEGSTIWIPI
jgi:hypothetical protein